MSALLTVSSLLMVAVLDEGIPPPPPLLETVSDAQENGSWE